MAISVDAQILIWGIMKRATANRQEMIGRAEYFFKKCEEDRQQVCIPAQSLAEFLVGYTDEQRRSSLAQLQRSFVVVPFDAKAAAIAAELQKNWNDAPARFRTPQTASRLFRW